MTVLREILIEWATVSGSGKRSVMYFFADIPVAQQREDIGDFLGAIDGILATTTAFGVAVSGREIEDSTGTLTGAWSEGTNYSGSGTGSGTAVADATQALVRWKTPTIAAGRFLQGRQFIPGVSNGNEVGGNLSGAAQTVLQGAANALIASASGLVIWHRPTSGVGGSSDTVTTADVWAEFAVLRRRRG